MDCGGSDCAKLEQAVQRLRTYSLYVVVAALVIAGIMAWALNVQADPDGSSFVVLWIAAGLIIGVTFRDRPGGHRLSDSFGALATISLIGLACGVISLMGLMIGYPLVDAELRTMDRALQFDGMAVVEWLAGHAPWLMRPFRFIYGESIPVLTISMLVLALKGRRVEVWRAAFCFAGGLITICLLSILTPAKGIYVTVTADVLSKLPSDAGRYFWQSFDRFHGSGSATVELASIDGVVSFPSFHTVIALITAALWRRSPVGFPIASAWAAVVLVTTVPIGGHYLVDLIAGALVWALWFKVSRFVEVGSVPHLGRPTATMFSRPASEPAS